MKILTLFLFLYCLSNVSFAADQNVTLLYAPQISITPDESQLEFPETLKVKLLISKKGTVSKVYFNDTTAPYIKKKVEDTLKIAQFTPYRRNGVALQSIVPFTVSFYLMSDLDYNGETE